ncbi:hypothetical protein BH11MYX4_BH11MYX4_44410 [soil metagenome]
MVWARPRDAVARSAKFVLFSEEYTRFSERYFGAFVEHAPGNAPRAMVDARPSLTRDELRERY